MDRQSAEFACERDGGGVVGTRCDDGGLVVQARFGIGHLVDLQAHIAERTCHSGGETGGLGGVEHVDGRVARGVKKRLLRIVAGWGAAGGFGFFSEEGLEELVHIFGVDGHHRLAVVAHAVNRGDGNGAELHIAARQVLHLHGELRWV